MCPLMVLLPAKRQVGGIEQVLKSQTLPCAGQALAL